MSQNTVVIPTTGTLSGLAAVQDINNALDTLLTNNSGAAAPSTIKAYQFWADTTNKQLKLRNDANSAWNTLFTDDGRLILGNVGSHAIGGATDANSQLVIEGTFAGSIDSKSLFVNSTLNPAASGYGLAVQINPTINKASSGTHPDFATLYLNAPT